MTESGFETSLRNIGICPTKKQLEQLASYCIFLEEYNKHTNLTAITEKEAVYLKHFYDSLTCLKHLKQNSKVLDFGTGAGFPGMVLAIFDPTSAYTLVDSVGKKTNFLKELKTKLDIQNVTIITARVEELKEDYLEHFDYIVVRAVAKLNTLLELGAPLLKIEGTLIALKSSLDGELEDTINASKKLGFVLEKKELFLLPISGDQRSIVLFQKQKTTPKKYPREFSQIKRNPL